MRMMRDARRAFRLPRGSWRPLGRAIVELALARVRLTADHSQHLLKAKRTHRAPCSALTKKQARLVDQVAFAIPRAADRVPWRADCLVQALAGERWLRRRGIAAQIIIGVKKDAKVPIDAHAWLDVGGQVVTGGDIADYTPLAD